MKNVPDYRTYGMMHLLRLLIVTFSLAPDCAFAMSGCHASFSLMPSLEKTAASDGGQFDANNYLSAAARISLRVRGYPELTGDYRVSPDRVISVPVIGRVSITGLDLAGLEKALSAKLSRIIQKEAFVTVEIAAYRSVFIAGAVKNPGAIEWRPGLTVLQAVTLTGGVVTENVPGAVPGSGVDANPVPLRKALDSQKRDLATIARLQAERLHAPSIEVPPSLISLSGRAEANDLIGRETEIMKNNRDSMASKLATLQQGIGAGNEEIASLRAQLGRLNTSLQLRSDYRVKIQGLFSRGVVSAERNIEEELKVTDLEEKVTNVNVGIAKASGTVAELQLAAVALQRDREHAINDELAKIERESAQLAIEIGARKTVRGMGSLEIVNNRPSEKTLSPFQIVRSRDGGSVKLVADQDTLMQPGDTLIVTLP